MIETTAKTVMPDVEETYSQATERLIALYRNLEQQMFELPFLSFRPFFVCIWAIVKFEFLVVVGLALILPTNFVIWVNRLLFSGKWRYRPFFLSYFRYAWLWIWRGEAPTMPLIFIRPLLGMFLKRHFEHRLRLLRYEIAVCEGLSEAKRLALLHRLEPALERWKPLRIAPVLLILIPILIGLPGCFKETLDFSESFGIIIGGDFIHIWITPYEAPMKLAVDLVGLYLAACLLTAFLAKRGLFIGISSNRVCFPGSQAGSGAYSKEKEILSCVGLHRREFPADLWFFAIASVFSLFLSHLIYALSTLLNSNGNLLVEEANSRISMTASVLINALFVAVAFIRRRRAGRA